MKLLYLSTWDFANEKADGVCKKIYSHIAVFEKEGYEVDFIFLRGNEIIYKENGQENVIGRVGNIKKTPAYIKMYKFIKYKKYDWVYNRYGMMDTFYYRVLKRLHRNGARILIELPTYPYKGERQKGLLYRIMFAWDELYIKKLRTITDKVLTYSRDKEIFGIPTIEMMNGVDVESIQPLRREEDADDTIDLLIVALMQPYHGYERLLKGLKTYYETGGARKIRCHFVGDGPEKKNYEELTEQYNLEEQVIFYGMKGGAELDAIYEKADIGICSLGCYKKGIYWSSELKSREYLAKGMPFVTGIEIDILRQIDEKYYIQFPNDESEIDVEKVVSFYDQLYTNDRKIVVEEIREMACRYIDMKAVMQPVCAHMAETLGGI